MPLFLLPARQVGGCWGLHVVGRVGMHEEDSLGWSGGGRESLDQCHAVEPASAEILEDVSVRRPTAAVAAFEVVDKWGGADDIAVQIDDGTAGGAVDGDHSVGVAGFYLSLDGCDINGAAAGAAA